jgi:hypothetical protein
MARDRDEDITNRPRDEDDRPRRRRDEDEDEPPRRRRRRYGEDNDLPRPDPEYLRQVAGAQKGIIYCILGQFALVPLNFALQSLPPEQALVTALSLGLTYLAVAVTATVFMFMLAVKVYSTGVGVVLGILTLIPCIGLIVLLVINQKATSILTESGVRVGLLGANSSDLR